MTKPKVLQAWHEAGGTLCLDLFERADGSLGIELYRKDPEDPSGWYPIGGLSALRFASREEALAKAQSTIDWFPHG